MNQPIPHKSITGAGMDTIVPKRNGKRVVIFCSVAVSIAIVGFALWRFMPRGLQVSVNDIRIASVVKGVFLDDIVVRTNAVPLNSVILDSVESGRVEEIYARDGAIVQKGDLLFRLSNPQRQLELLARQSDQATQISNISNLRVGWELSRADHQRRLTQLEFDLEQAKKKYVRDTELAAKGFISKTALEESVDKTALLQHDLEEEKQNVDVEDKTRRDAIAQMQGAIENLQSGMKVVNTTIDALKVRAPVAGRLTNFNLQVGETVKPDERTGRIDDPEKYKLSALVDEFYLNRVAVGVAGKAHVDNDDYPLSVSRIYPQIKDGRFTVELNFVAKQPAEIHPGQRLDAQITLGTPSPALLLPNSEFINDSGGAWVFVVNADGDSAERRAIRVGRRNNSQVEVLSGLTKDEKVIVSAYALYGAATHLQITK